MTRSPPAFNRTEWPYMDRPGESNLTLGLVCLIGTIIGMTLCGFVLQAAQRLRP